jgi:hypothetical protein
VTRANKLVRVRKDNVLEVMDTEERPYLQVRPGYEPLLGPCIHLYRVGIHETPSYLTTIRLPVVSEIVRNLPVVYRAAARLRTLAPSNPLARTPTGRRSAAK